MFKFQVIESDLLPNHVCMECWTKISDFHAFHSRIRTAQARYLNDLVKYEGETNSFVDVFEPGHLNIEDAYADQQIDVLAAVNDEQNEATIKTEHETFKSIFIETSEQMTLDESMETSESDQFKVSEQTEYSNESGNKQFDAMNFDPMLNQYGLYRCRHRIQCKTKTIHKQIRYT